MIISSNDNIHHPHSKFNNKTIYILVGFIGVLTIVLTYYFLNTTKSRDKSIANNKAQIQLTTSEYLRQQFVNGAGTIAFEKPLPPAGRNFRFIGIDENSNYLLNKDGVIVKQSIIDRSDTIISRNQSTRRIGNAFIIHYQDGYLIVYNWRNSKTLAKIKTNDLNPIKDDIYLSDGKLLYATCSSKSIKVFDMTTNKLIKLIPAIDSKDVVIKDSLIYFVKTIPIDNIFTTTKIVSYNIFNDAVSYPREVPSFSNDEYWDNNPRIPETIRLKSEQGFYILTDGETIKIKETKSNKIVKTFPLHTIPMHGYFQDTHAYFVYYNSRFVRVDNIGTAKVPPPGHSGYVGQMLAEEQTFFDNVSLWEIAELAANYSMYKEHPKEYAQLNKPKGEFESSIDYSKRIRPYKELFANTLLTFRNKYDLAISNYLRSVDSTFLSHYEFEQTKTIPYLNSKINNLSLTIDSLNKSSRRKITLPYDDWRIENYDADRKTMTIWTSWDRIEFPISVDDAKLLKSSPRSFVLSAIKSFDYLKDNTVIDSLILFNKMSKTSIVAKWRMEL